MTDFPLLSLMIWIPAFGAVVILFVKGKTAARCIGLLSTILVFTLFLLGFGWFESHTGDFQFVEKIPWKNSLGIF